MNFYRHLCLLDSETPALGPLCRNHGPFLAWLCKPQLNRGEQSSLDWILCCFVPPCVQYAAFNHNNLTTHKFPRQTRRDEVLFKCAPATANVGSENNVNALQPTQHRNTSQKKKSPHKMPPRLPLNPHPSTGRAADHLACGISHCTPHCHLAQDRSKEIRTLTPMHSPSSKLNSYSISLEWCLEVLLLFSIIVKMTQPTLWVE